MSLSLPSAPQLPVISLFIHITSQTWPPPTFIHSLIMVSPHWPLGFVPQTRRLDWLILLLGNSSLYSLMLLLLPLLNFVQTSPSQTGLLWPPCLGCIQPPLIPTPLCFTFLLLYQHLTSLLPIILISLFTVFLPSVKWMLHKFRDFSSFSFPAES